MTDVPDAELSYSWPGTEEHSVTENSMSSLTSSPEMSFGPVIVRILVILWDRFFFSLETMNWVIYHAFLFLLAARKPGAKSVAHPYKNTACCGP